MALKALALPKNDRGIGHREFRAYRNNKGLQTATAVSKWSEAELTLGGYVSFGPNLPFCFGVLNRGKQT